MPHPRPGEAGRGTWRTPWDPPKALPVPEKEKQRGVETRRAKEIEHIDEMESSLEGQEEWTHCNSSATNDGD